MIETIAVEVETVRLVEGNYERCAPTAEGVEYAVYLRIKHTPASPALATHVFTGDQSTVERIAQGLASAHGMAITNNAHGA